MEFVGLDWEEGTLAFQDATRVVTTASVNEVRQPMYNTSVDKWRRYEEHLMELKAALEPSSHLVL